MAATKPMARGVVDADGGLQAIAVCLEHILADRQGILGGPLAVLLGNTGVLRFGQFLEPGVKTGDPVDAGLDLMS